MSCVWGDPSYSVEAILANARKYVKESMDNQISAKAEAVVGTVAPRAALKKIEDKEKSRKKVEVLVSTDSAIRLPDGMSKEEAIEALNRETAEDERNVAIDYSIACFPLDGALAMYKVLKKKFGWTGQVPTPGMFGPRDPVIVNVETGPNGEMQQVPWGGIEMSGIKGYLNTDFKFTDGKPMFRMTGKVKQKHKKEVEEIFEEIKKTLKKESIYRGKAIKVAFEGEDFDPDDYDPTVGPTFIDTAAIKEANLVLSKEAMEQVQVGLFTPIEHSKECRKYGIPLKRGILLSGPYGVGKSMTASVTAKKCVDNNWTYIYLESAKQLAQGIFFAHAYSPALVFVEDVDSVAGGNMRTDQVNEVLNTIDGIDNKEAEVITVFTTNHIERINPAMMRPGRVDTLITLTPPDEQAAFTLLRQYGGELLEATDDELRPVARILAETKRIPAFIREVIERSKLRGIHRLKRGHSLTVTAEDLLSTLGALDGHQASMNKEAMSMPHPMSVLGSALGQEIANGLVAAGLMTYALKNGKKVLVPSDSN